jgi:ribose transport system substrate-binding protein
MKQKTGVEQMQLQKKLAVAFLLSAILGGEAASKDITIGFSWNQKESSLETAWEDYLKSEGKVQGDAAGVTIKWIFNVANGDPARQAANIEDLINKGVDIVMARAEDSAAISASIKAAKAANIPFITFDRGGKAHSACRRRQL